MENLKRDQHKSPKYVEPTTEGHCPYCHKPVKSLESHIHDKHKKEKLLKK